MKGVVVVGIVFVFLINLPLSLGEDNNFVISTEDGVSLSLDGNGWINSLKIDDNEVIDESSPVFYIRDLTVDYSIENLVLNPSFEEDEDNDGIADNWTPKTLQGEMNISLDKQNAHSGSHSIKMFSRSTDKQNKMIYISSLILVESDTEYCLSFYSKVSFGFLDESWSTSAGVYCIFYNHSGGEISKELLQIHHTIYSWKQFSKIFITPIDAETARIIIFFIGPKYYTIPGMENCTVWFDDIVLYKMPDETKMKPIIGGIEQDADKLIYNGVFENLEFKATYESKGEYIEINMEIKDNQREEKALNLYFLLPVDATNWLWWDDIRNHRNIENEIYETTINADESSYLPLSIYPTSAITEGDIGLSIAIPLSKPRVFKIFYDTKLDKFGISFNLGLSPLTKFNMVNYTIYLYRCNPEWGFRSALERYYTFFPEYFDEKINLEFMNATGEFADFGVRFIQGSFHDEKYAKYLSELNKNHIYTCEYTLPSAFEPKSLQSINEPAPNYEGFVGLIDYYIENGYLSLKMKARGAKNSTVEDISNDIILGQILRGPNWASDSWVGRFPLNVDPDLPYLNIASATIETLIIPAFENAEKYNATLNGIEIDNFMKMCRYIDMNKSRFQYSDLPLIYNPNNFKPGIHTMDTMVEYLHYLSNWLKENHPHAKITGNCVERGVASFGFPYLAALPFEMGSISDWNFNDIELNYRRSMAYHRFVMAFQCNKMYDDLGRVNIRDVYDFVNESIFYGIYPIMKEDFFENCNYETVRDLYKKIIPIVDELNIAGWEPITYAETTNDIWTERFGKEGTIYFTVRNNDSITKNYRLTIEVEKLGIERDIYIIDMLANSNVSFEYDTKGDIIINDNINSKETKVFKISNISMLNIEITKPRENWLYIFNKAISPIGKTIIIGSITIETNVYSSNGIDRIEFYIDDILKFTDYEYPYQWLWDEFAVGPHKIEVMAYDTKGNEIGDKMGVIIFSLRG